ncbi:MAG TPA: sulfite exporter TauE/SafE family protein [Halothiobacillaceae bacterium]|nr:sulfite exporter TauE/SafE family protein [Halothiobacillaceae bacterium]
MDIAWGAWLLASVVVFIGSFMQGVVGYGVALFSAPLLFLINPALVPAPLLIIGGLMPLMLLRANWRYVKKQDLFFAYPGSVLGVLLATVLVNLFAQTSWQLVFGVAILAAVVLSLMRFNIQPTKPVVFSGAFGSGLMGTLTAVGGPPLGLAYQNAEPGRIRGTLSAIFAPLSVLSLTALGFSGMFGWADIVLAAGLMPAVIAGFFAAKRLGHRIPTYLFPKIMLLAATLGGGYALVRGILNLI